MKTSFAQSLMKVWILLALTALANWQALAQNPPGAVAGSLAAREAETCSRNLKIIYESIQAYRKDHKEVPDWLSDLVPKYLADSAVLTCPVTARTGRTQTHGLSDPKVTASYAFDFCAQEVPPELWGGSPLSMRQFKNLQMAVVGGDTPILRCYLHTPTLNVGFNGKSYESERVWENRFKQVAPLRDLSPQRLVERFAIQRADRPARGHGHLEFVDSLTNPDLRSVVGIAVSPDGKFVYASAYNSAALVAFSRDETNGRLAHLQTISDRTTLQGAVHIRLSPDGRYGLVASFVSRTVSLFERDSNTGRMKLLDVARDGADGIEGLNWVIDAEFSPDARFIYALGSRSAAVVAFRQSPEGKLHFIEANHGKDQCFEEARGLAFSPNGRLLYVASSDAGTLAVLERDDETGKTKLKQLLKDEEYGIHGLGGVMRLKCSPDGKFLYTSSGRFKGDNALGLYKTNPDQTLSMVKELFNGQEGLTRFEGGNELILTPDGLNVYALGTRSSSLVVFQRDLETGALTQNQTFLHDTYGGGPVLSGTSGLAISPDGRHLYVTAELSQAISIFNRSVRR